MGAHRPNYGPGSSMRRRYRGSHGRVAERKQLKLKAHTEAYVKKSPQQQRGETTIKSPMAECGSRQQREQTTEAHGAGGSRQQREQTTEAH
ncbi:unnamed protein product, partial [Staurois parvus]